LRPVSNNHNLFETSEGQDQGPDQNQDQKEQTQKSLQKLANFEAIKELKERAIIEQNEAVKYKIRKILKDQCNIVCKDSDLKELQMIKEQVGNLCTKDKVIELLMAN